ncbi:MAG: hypothetical protein Kow001_12320 [Acidobacteriota bacterium]
MSRQAKPREQTPPDSDSSLKGCHKIPLSADRPPHGPATRSANARERAVCCSHTGRPDFWTAPALPPDSPGRRRNALPKAPSSLRIAGAFQESSPLGIAFDWAIIPA